VPNICIASDLKDFPMACVAVTNAVLGKTNENLLLSADVERDGIAKGLPSHLELDVVLGFVRLHDLPMSSDTDEEEPET
jgi:hypothetical protein